MSDATATPATSEPATPPLARALDTLARVATIIAALALLALVAVEGWQVFARYVRNDSPGWTEPLALLLVNTAMMLGAAVGVRRDTHFGFSLAVDAMPPRARAAVLMLTNLVIVLIGGLLARWGVALLRDNWDVPMAGAGLPQGLIFAPTVVGGVLMALFAIARFVGARARTPAPVAAGEP
jgi:TRAP-type C4-dicarboxylate transport system permease small subunit